MSENKNAPEPRPEEVAYTIPADLERSIYRFIVVAGKRARQLQSGARPKVPVAGRKLTRVAVEETRRGFVPFIDLGNPPPSAEEEQPVTGQ